METIERLRCTGVTRALFFTPAGVPLDLGDRERLFNQNHKVMMAIRDGGCSIDGCPMPPSMTEMHHTTPWSEGGKTDIEDGILLCRLHHLLLHERAWRIYREGATRFLLKSLEDDPTQTPIRLRSKNPLMREIERRTG